MATDDAGDEPGARSSRGSPPGVVRSCRSSQAAWSGVAVTTSEGLAARPRRTRRNVPRQARRGRRGTEDDCGTRAAAGCGTDRLCRAMATGEVSLYWSRRADRSHRHPRPRHHLAAVCIPPTACYAIVPRSQDAVPSGVLPTIWFVP